MDPYTTPGAFSWSELTTPDPAQAAAFYGNLFGWTFKDMGDAMGGYTVASQGETQVAGIMAPPPGAPPMPPAWGCYVTVSQVETTVQRCLELGGKVLVPPMDVPGVGRMAVIQDPQGATLSVMQYSTA
jgi:predicted enzyme related to lactoylglutathione lyase